MFNKACRLHRGSKGWREALFSTSFFIVMVYRNEFVIWQN